VSKDKGAKTTTSNLFSADVAEECSFNGLSKYTHPLLARAKHAKELSMTKEWSWYVATIDSSILVSNNMEIFRVKHGRGERWESFERLADLVEHAMIHGSGITEYITTHDNDVATRSSFRRHMKGATRILGRSPVGSDEIECVYLRKPTWFGNEDGSGDWLCELTVYVGEGLPRLEA